MMVKTATRIPWKKGLYLEGEFELVNPTKVSDAEQDIKDIRNNNENEIGRRYHSTYKEYIDQPEYYKDFLCAFYASRGGLIRQDGNPINPSGTGGQAQEETFWDVKEQNAKLFLILEERKREEQRAVEDVQRSKNKKSDKREGRIEMQGWIQIVIAILGIGGLGVTYYYHQTIINIFNFFYR